MASRLTTFLCVMPLLTPSSSSAFNVAAFLKDGAKGTWDMAPPNGMMAFFCAPDAPIWTREILASGFAGRVVLPSHWLSALGDVTRSAPLGMLTLVVDLRCPNTEDLFRKATELEIVRRPYRWLLLRKTGENRGDGSCRNLASALTEENSVLTEAKATDADFVLVCGGDNGTAELVDPWGSQGPTLLGHWFHHGPVERFQSDRRSPSVRRMAAGLSGYVFRTGVVITRNDTLIHLNDAVNRQHDFMTKFNWEVIHVLVRMLNSSINVTFVSDWGYPKNGTWTGLLGMQIRREAEIGGTPTAMVHDRLKIQVYLNYMTPVQGIFIFREPPMSYEYNLFTQPFPTSLWLAISAIVALGAALLYGTLRLEETTGVEKQQSISQLNEGRKRKLDASFGDVALLTFGAVCQQGSPVEARGVPGRIITLFIFFGILFFYTSYSASIVALLQSTASNIKTYPDFLKSRIPVGVENTTYNQYYMRTASDKIRRAIYLKKITDYGRRNAFMSLEEGVNRMRRSYFAFHSLRSSIYAVISDTFEENEKCGLREVGGFLTVKFPQITASYWSPHTELVRIALRRIQERGIRDRQLQRFVTQKPVCVSQGGNFQSVSLTDCFAAFVVLGIGIGVATMFLLLEMAAFHRSQLLTRCQKHGIKDGHTSYLTN